MSTDADPASAARRVAEADSAYNREIGDLLRERRVGEIMARHPGMSRYVAERYADQEPPALEKRDDGRS